MRFYLHIPRNMHVKTRNCWNRSLRVVEEMSCYGGGAQKPTQRQESARFAPDVPSNASEPVSQNRPPCLPIFQAQCISDLQKSHVALSTQLSKLQDKFATLEQRMSSEAHRHRHQGEEASALKVLAFTKIRAAATLCKGKSRTWKASW